VLRLLREALRRDPPVVRFAPQPLRPRHTPKED
jgi:hypothetical protein